MNCLHYIWSSIFHPHTPGHLPRRVVGRIASHQKVDQLFNLPPRPRPRPCSICGHTFSLGARLITAFLPTDLPPEHPRIPFSTRRQTSNHYRRRQLLSHVNCLPHFPPRHCLYWKYSGLSHDMPLGLIRSSLPNRRLYIQPHLP